MSTRFALGAALAAITAPFAQADLLNIAGAGALGSYTGTISYVYNSGNTGTLTIALTTTSANGGKLTGFAFNIDGLSAIATLSSADYAFLNTGTTAASPYGTFEAGAALGANWEGGGNPNAGIATGKTGHFVFAVAGTDASRLTAQSFDEPTGTNFVVRFRGFDGGGSDKVLGTLTPAPASLSAVVAGLGLLRRRRSL